MGHLVYVYPPHIVPAISIKIAIYSQTVSRGDDTPVGIVRDATRAGQRIILTDLGRLMDHEFDMRTVVIVGNSTTRNEKGLLLTPREYRSQGPDNRRILEMVERLSRLGGS